MDTITFQRPDARLCHGYYVEPENPHNDPGVVMLQEWWGLNDQIKHGADKLAAAGYRVLIPDLAK
ncbi:MAG: hypothetical protein F6K42_29690 [Leptolyngbya sp. SIO1D8]|nr:hypothetical protein [Leptolyngbya sp. SIO1D8]